MEEYQYTSEIVTVEKDAKAFAIAAPDDDEDYAIITQATLVENPELVEVDATIHFNLDDEHDSFVTSAYIEE